MDSDLDNVYFIIRKLSSIAHNAYIVGLITFYTIHFKQIIYLRNV